MAIGMTALVGWSLTTHTMQNAELSKQPANLFSDLAIHHMGPGLADGIPQGLANGDEFRTAPLWGSASGSSSCTTAAPATC